MMRRLLLLLPLAAAARVRRRVNGASYYNNVNNGNFANSYNNGNYNRNEFYNYDRNDNNPNYNNNRNNNNNYNRNSYNASSQSNTAQQQQQGISNLGKVLISVASIAFTMAMLSYFAPDLTLGAIGHALASFCFGSRLAQLKQHKKDGSSQDDNRLQFSLKSTNSSATENINALSYISATSTDYDEDLNNALFEDQVQKARVEFSRIEPHFTTVSLLSGPYSILYVDRSNGVKNLHFIKCNNNNDNNNNSFLSITGDGHDVIHGITHIEDGRVNFDGTAWWLERVINPKGATKDLSILSRGRFMQNHAFYGSFLTSNMDSGDYLSFTIRHEYNNSNATPTLMYNNDETLTTNETIDSIPIVSPSADYTTMSDDEDDNEY